MSLIFFELFLVCFVVKDLLSLFSKEKEKKTSKARRRIAISSSSVVCQSETLNPLPFYFSNQSFVLNYLFSSLLFPPRISPNTFLFIHSLFKSLSLSKLKKKTFAIPDKTFTIRSKTSRGFVRSQS